MGSLSSLKRDSSTFSCEAHNVCIIDSLAFQQAQVSEKSACTALSKICILNIYNIILLFVKVLTWLVSLLGFSYFFIVRVNLYRVPIACVPVEEWSVCHSIGNFDRQWNITTTITPQCNRLNNSEALCTALPTKMLQFCPHYLRNNFNVL